MAMVPSSLSRLQDVMEQRYNKCLKCDENVEDRLRILPCLHVVCTVHLETALRKARVKTHWPRSRTKYTDHRRFLCPVCDNPYYLHTEEFNGYPMTSPIKALLLDEKPPTDEEIQSTDEKESRRYLTRMGDFFFHSEIGDHGTDPYAGCFTRISGIQADESSGKARDIKLVICDGALNTITVMKMDGTVVHLIVTEENVRNICLRKDNNNVVATVSEKDYGLVEWNLHGQRVREFFDKSHGFGPVIECEPFGVAVDSLNRFTVTLLKTDRFFCYHEDFYRDDCRDHGGAGRGSCQFKGPYFLTTMSHGSIVVSDTLNHRIKVHSAETGLMKVMFGGKGWKPGELFYPQGVCVDGENNIYVADSGNYRVQVFTDLGGYVSSPVVETWNYGRPDQNVRPTQVCVLKDGQLLVAMHGHGYSKIHIYRPRYAGFQETEVKSGHCCGGCLGCCHGDYEPIN